MRNLALLGAVFLLTSLGVGQAAHAACGSADVVKGKVEVARGSAAAVPLKQGEKVCSGDVVTTAAESRVKLSMQDGNVLNVNPGTSMKIEAYVNDPGSAKKKVLLNVLYGKMRATVNQKYDGKSSSGEPQLFQVKTKSAVAGVRGTDFLTSFSPRANKMEVVTFEGKVEVGKAGPGGAIMNSVSVGAGQKTEAAVGQPPAPPKPVPASELKQMEASSQAGPAGERPSTDKGAAGESGKDKEKSDDSKGDKKGNDDKKGEGDKKGADGDKKQADGGDKKSAEGDKKQADGGDKKGAEGDRKQADGGDGKKSDAKKGPEGDKKQAGAEPKKGGDGGGSDKGSGGSDGKSTARNGGGNAAGPGSGSGSAGNGDGSGSRSPASTSGSGGGSGTKIAVDTGAPPPPPPPPPPPTMPTIMPTVQLPPTMQLPVLPPTCDFCNTAVQNGPAKVNIKICLPGQPC